MACAVVNEHLVYHTASSGGLSGGEYSGEKFMYMIFENPSMAITTGEPAKYALSIRFKGNMLIWPDFKYPVTAQCMKRDPEKEKRHGLIT
jgi:hypothetical protein